jgi:L-ascorbate metabolism protein UlaG (beta-lactamase superfamily)
MPFLPRHQAVPAKRRGNFGFAVFFYEFGKAWPGASSNACLSATRHYQTLFRFPMKITYYGHSCFGVEISGKHLLFDPFISPNPLASQIDLEAIPADYILLSHGHGDHVADVEAIARRTGAKLLGCYEVTAWFEAKGISNYHPMNVGGKVQLDFGTVKFVEAVHSSTMPDGSPGGVAGGFVVRADEGSFYYAGDTALHYDMQLIGRFERLKFAFLPIGDNFTMGVEDALVAADFIGCKEIIGMHYDTFPYVAIEQAKAVDTFARAGKNLHLMAIGDSAEM